MLRQGFAAVLVALAIAPAALAADASVQATAQSTWSPATVSIGVGEKVTWTNPSGNFHNVHFPAGGFTQPAQPSPSWPPGGVVRTFSSPGSYSYVCQAHPGMTGTVNVSATERVYTGVTGGTWEEASNWTPAGIPGPGETAKIGDGKTVFVNGAHTVGRLDMSGNAIRAGEGVLTLTGGGTWTSARTTGKKTIVSPGATLTWSGGSLLEGELENLGALTIENVGFGDGEPGADVAILDNQGAATMTGNLTDASQGGARVLNAGTFTATVLATLSPAVSNTGTMRAVTGGRLILTGGTVTPSTGAWTTDATGWLAFGAGTYAMEAGSQVTGPGRIVVAGNLDVQAGATFAVAGATDLSGTLTLAPAGSTGLLILAGGTRAGGGTLTAGDLDTADLPVGTFASGTTIVQSAVTLPAGEFDVDAPAVLSFPAGLAVTAGEYELLGTIEAGGAIAIAPGTLLTGDFSEFQVLASGTLALDGLALTRVRTFGTTTLDGTFTGAVAVEGGTLTASGTISGELMLDGGLVAPGQLSVGKYEQNAGTLRFGIRGKSDFDRLTAGEVFLDGGAVAAQLGYTPAAGDAWRVLVTTQDPGAFDSVTPATVGYRSDAQGGVLFLKEVKPEATATAVASATATATATPAPVPGVTPSAAPPFGALVKLPKCVSKRKLRVRLIAPATSVRVLLGRKQLKRSAGSFTLRRLPRRAFTLKFEVTIQDGRVVKGSKRFRRCG